MARDTTLPLRIDPARGLEFAGMYYPELKQRLRTWGRVNVPEVTHEVDEEVLIQVENAVALETHYCQTLIDHAATELALETAQTREGARLALGLIGEQLRPAAPARARLVADLSKLPDAPGLLARARRRWSNRPESGVRVIYENPDDLNLTARADRFAALAAFCWEWYDVYQTADPLRELEYRYTPRAADKDLPPASAAEPLEGFTYLRRGRYAADAEFDIRYPDRLYARRFRNATYLRDQLVQVPGMAYTEPEDTPGDGGVGFYGLPSYRIRRVGADAYRATEGRVPYYIEIAGRFQNYEALAAAVSSVHYRLGFFFDLTAEYERHLAARGRGEEYPFALFPRRPEPGDSLLAAHPDVLHLAWELQGLQEYSYARVAPEVFNPGRFVGSPARVAYQYVPTAGAGSAYWYSQYVQRTAAYTVREALLDLTPLFETNGVQALPGYSVMVFHVPTGRVHVAETDVGGPGDPPELSGRTLVRVPFAGWLNDTQDAMADPLPTDWRVEFYWRPLSVWDALLRAEKFTDSVDLAARVPGFAPVPVDALACPFYPRLDGGAGYLVRFRLLANQTRRRDPQGQNAREQRFGADAFLDANEPSYAPVDADLNVPETDDTSSPAAQRPLPIAKRLVVKTPALYAWSVVQGETRRDARLGSSNGLPGQTFYLPQAHYVDGSLRLTVNGEEWEEVQSFVTSGPRDRHYRVEVDRLDRARVRFGDGEMGRIPDVGQNNVTAVEYRVYGAEVLDGNLGAGEISQNVDGVDGFRDVRNPRAAEGYTLPGGATPALRARAKVLGPARLRETARATTAAEAEALAVAYRTADGRQLAYRAVAMEVHALFKGFILSVVGADGNALAYADLLELAVYFNGAPLSGQGGALLSNYNAMLVPYTPQGIVVRCAAYWPGATAQDEAAVFAALRDALQPLTRDPVSGAYLWDFGGVLTAGKVEQYVQARLPAVRAIVVRFYQFTWDGDAGRYVLAIAQTPTEFRLRDYRALPKLEEAVSRSLVQVYGTLEAFTAGQQGAVQYGDPVGFNARLATPAPVPEVQLVDRTNNAALPCDADGLPLLEFKVALMANMFSVAAPAGTVAVTERCLRVVGNVPEGTISPWALQGLPYWLTALPGSGTRTPADVTLRFRLPADAWHSWAIAHPFQTEITLRHGGGSQRVRVLVRYGEGADYQPHTCLAAGSGNSCPTGAVCSGSPPPVVSIPPGEVRFVNGENNVGLLDFPLEEYNGEAYMRPTFVFNQAGAPDRLGSGFVTPFFARPVHLRLVGDRAAVAFTGLRLPAFGSSLPNWIEEVQVRADAIENGLLDGADLQGYPGKAGTVPVDLYARPNLERMIALVAELRALPGTQAKGTQDAGVLKSVVTYGEGEPPEELEIQVIFYLLLAVGDASGTRVARVFWLYSDQQLVPYQLAHGLPVEVDGTGNFQRGVVTLPEGD